MTIEFIFDILKTIDNSEGTTEPLAVFVRSSGVSHKVVAIALAELQRVEAVRVVLVEDRYATAMLTDRGRAMLALLTSSDRQLLSDGCAEELITGLVAMLKNNDGRKRLS